MKISLIKPYSANAKQHDKKQINQVANSIRRFGFVQPIVIDKNNEIVIGHCRYEASKVLGLVDVPTISVEKLSDKEVKALRLADNKLNESAWSMDLVIDELKLLDPELLDLTGFSRDLIIEPNDQDDVIPDNVPPRAKLGDLWQLGSHMLLCGDCTQEEAVLRLMGDVKADMCFTDPPYGVNYTGKTKKALKIMNDVNVFELLMGAFNQMNESLKAGASVYITHADSGRVDFTSAFVDSGFYLSSVIIWVKNNATFGRQDYFWKHEPILYGWKEKGSHKWYGDNTQTTIWNIDRPAKAEVHPTMKPIELITKALVNSSKEGDIVLDPFLGSGSTLIACEKTNRICMGCELDEKYCDVIIQRWESYTGEKGKKVDK